MRRPGRRPPPSRSPRSVAVDVLVRVEAGAYSNLLLGEVLRRSGLDPRARAFVTDLVYGTIRGQRALDHLLAPISSRPLGVLDPRVRAALRLGGYQLTTGVAPHAAVGETVAAAPRRAAGFVNGVLRALDRAGPPWPWPEGDTTEALGVRTSHPDWIVEELRSELGEAEAERVLALDNEAPALTLRVNPRRATPDAVEAELRAAGVEVARGRLLPEALVLIGSGDPQSLPAVRDGRASPQDQASQAVVALLDPQPGERLLDLAAAPGGKACAAAERMRDLGLVAAGDINPGRSRLVREATRRLGLRCVTPVVADGRTPPFRDSLFDRVLLDAPCSGLGVLRRRPEARWRVTRDDADRLAALQRELLGAAAAAVRPGGRVVYAVCTLTAAETRDIDAWSAGALPQLSALPPPGPPWRPHGRGWLLLPTEAGSDGMFVLSFERD